LVTAITEFRKEYYSYYGHDDDDDDNNNNNIIITIIIVGGGGGSLVLVMVLCKVASLLLVGSYDVRLYGFCPNSLFVSLPLGFV
jgi:hypothetical protein